jgi:hypothetical protein
MARPPFSFAFEMEPIPPSSFELTVRKPEGWPLFTPFEVYGRSTISTAAYICRQLAGIKITSQGTTEHPKIAARIFLGRSQALKHWRR